MIFPAQIAFVVHSYIMLNSLVGIFKGQIAWHTDVMLVFQMIIQLILIVEIRLVQALIAYKMLGRVCNMLVL
jgi:hypothetical protein